MGSFDLTCCVSGLPIRPSDEVRVALLTEGPYHSFGELTCHAHDRAFPRTFPLRGKYDDYGRVAPLKGERFTGAVADTWVCGFEVDLVECGVGDNSVHDVAVRRGMSVEEYLTATSEGRVRVRRGDGATLRGAVEAPAGIPSLRGVEAVVAASAFSDEEKRLFLVDSPRYGEARVRWDGLREAWGKDEEKLAALLPAFAERYAVMLSAGTGSYAHGAELWLRPKVGADFHGNDAEERPASLGVGQWVVREDVWQALVELELPELPGLRAYRRAARRLYAACLASARDWRLYNTPWPRGCDAELLHCVTKDAVPFTVGLGASWDYFCEARRGEAVPAQRSAGARAVSAFLDCVADFARLTAVLSKAGRYQWRVVSTVGLQCGEFKDSSTYLAALQWACRAAAKRWRG